ncbi:hypothetical protein RUM44_010423 [Polyplax serrata]|uniref:ZP domain-containing protein n=1 Tax=Polyplax serrata TaxID=468196 RepID=A0ABR1AVI6_POLSC
MDEKNPFQTATGEEVEVVEAVQGIHGGGGSAHDLGDSAQNNNAQDREDTDISLEEQVSNHDDQQAAETSSKHNYQPTNRGHPISLPNRPNGNKPFNGPHHGKQPIFDPNLYQGPPPPPPPKQADASDKVYKVVAPNHGLGGLGGIGGIGGLGGDPWPAPMPDMPKIVSLDVKCEKSSMKVYIAFDKPFYGIVFSKGHYSNVNCVYLPAGLGRTSANFEISIHACGTAGNTENGLYGYGAESGSGTYFENIIVIQYDPQVQEVWDQARKLRCTWHDQYEKSVTFRPFPVDMLDVVRADFAGDNVGCWMQIQVGKGPWASEVSGLVKIGQTMTMVLAIKDDDSKFDMLVRNCMAHDGKRAPIQLVDQKGCVTRPKLMSRFTKIKNFGASASVLSYAHFQAFKFPDSMEVHFQCTIQICRYQCPDQCSDPHALLHQGAHAGILEAHASHGGPIADQNIGLGHSHLALDAYLGGGAHIRDERRVGRRHRRETAPEKEVGLNRIIRVVSTGDLTFSLEDSGNMTEAPTIVVPAGFDTSGKICMSTSGFAATLVVLLSILIISCLMSAVLCIRLRPFSAIAGKNLAVAQTNPTSIQPKRPKWRFWS